MALHRAMAHSSKAQSPCQGSLWQQEHEIAGHIAAMSGSKEMDASTWLALCFLFSLRPHGIPPAIQSLLRHVQRLVYMVILIPTKLTIKITISYLAPL